MEFNPMAFIDNLYYMIAGMVCIFIVIGIIILATMFLNSIMKKK